MSSKKIKAKEFEESSTDESDEDVDEEENVGESEIIDVLFDVKEPEEYDFHGIKNLLHQLFLKADVNLSELTNLLIEQQNITGVIKQAETEDDMETEEVDLDVNFGVYSLINLTEKRDLECVKQIKTYLLSKSKQADMSAFERLQQMFNNTKEQVGLVISERMVNIPAKIAPPIYQSLSSDMQKRKKIDHFIWICKTMVFGESLKQATLVYTNPEEEIIAELSTQQFDFSVAGENDPGLSGRWTDRDTEGHRKRRVLIMPATQWPEMCRRLEREIHC